jgi:hypothetical protein
MHKVPLPKLGVAVGCVLTSRPYSQALDKAIKPANPVKNSCHRYVLADFEEAGCEWPKRHVR